MVNAKELQSIIEQINEAFERIEKRLDSLEEPKKESKTTSKQEKSNNDK
jgi:hypothetical protein